MRPAQRRPQLLLQSRRKILPHKIPIDLAKINSAVTGRSMIMSIMATPSNRPVLPRNVFSPSSC